MPVISRSVSDKPARLVFVRRTSNPNVWRVDLPALGAPATSAPVLAIASTMLDTNPQVSPDGKRVAFQSNRSGSYEIWVADLDGANALLLTAMGAPSGAGTPLVSRWTDDRVRSSVEGQVEVYVVPAGGGKPRRMTFEPADDHVPSFSRAGSFSTSVRNGAAWSKSGSCRSPVGTPHR